MLINAITYTDFYKILSETFARIEYISKGKNPKIYSTRSFWNVTVGSKNIHRILQIIEGENCGISSYDYFYRIAGKMNKDLCLRNEINEHAFYKALIYIEENREHIDRPPVIKETCDSQFRHFLETYQLFERHKKTEAAINAYLTSIDYLNEDQSIVDDKPIDSEVFVAGEQVIEQFYTFLSAKRFDDAWSLLTPDFQFRNWPKDNSDEELGDIKKFIDGYKNTSEILYKNVFRIVKESENNLKGYIFYDDSLLLHPIKEFMDVSFKTIEESNELLNNIETFIKKLGDYGSEFNQIPIRFLFHKTLSEKLLSSCKIPKAKMAAISSKPHNEIVSRLSVVFLKREGGNYLINFIDDVDVVPLH